MSELETSIRTTLRLALEENERLRAALKPFARLADQADAGAHLVFTEDERPVVPFGWHASAKKPEDANMGHCRAARASLTPPTEGAAP